MLTALLLCMVPPPSAETLREYAVSPPVIPGNAIRYVTSTGVRLAIIPEDLIYKTITTTTTMPSCGMGWCVTHPQVTIPRTQRVCENYPTPLPDIEQALRAIKLTRDDVLYDLGCGDGRVCIMASKEYNCFSVGLDIRKEAAILAYKNAVMNEIQHLASFYALPIEGQRLQHATVVYCYLKPETMATLRIPENVRAGISYKHPWPGVRKQQVGDFFIWNRPAKTAAVIPRPVVRASCPGGS